MRIKATFSIHSLVAPPFLGMWQYSPVFEYVGRPSTAKIYVTGAARLRIEFISLKSSVVFSLLVQIEHARKYRRAGFVSAYLVFVGFLCRYRGR